MERDIYYLSTSYLSDRSIHVKIYNSLSSPSPMKYDVPQGSLIGLSLFSIYVYPLLSIISKYPNIYYHLYMIMTYNYICFFTLIHHQVSIINSPSNLMKLKNGLFLIIFSLIPTKLHS